MKRIFFMLLWIGAQATFAQQKPILEAEYFFDNVDPGYGQGFPIPVPTPSESLDLIFSVPATGLLPGMHQIDVRVKRDSAWSDTHRRFFFITDTTLMFETDADIVSAEYFLGEVDPGMGQGTQLLISQPASEIDLVDEIDITSLSSGFHKISLRVKRELGGWSDTHQRFFYIPDSTSAFKINSIAYELKQGGTQIGMSNIAINPAQYTVEMTFDVGTAGLSPGFYEICTWAIDEQLRASAKVCRTFEVTGSGGGGGGVAIEDEPMSRIRAYPNPTTGPLTIESERLPILSYQLSDVQGRILFHEKPATVVHEASLDLQGYPSGIYFLGIEVKGELRVKMVEVR